MRPDPHQDLTDPMNVTRALTTTQIAGYLCRLTEEGGGRNFVIFHARCCLYVQFLTSCGSARVYGEAASGAYGTPRCRCAPAPVQQWRLRELGWRPPTRTKRLNFHRNWPFVTERDRQALAETVFATLEVFGANDEAPKATLHLDW